MTRTLRVGLVGCGLVGRKRAKALGRHSLVAVADANAARAKELASAHPGATVFADWRRLVQCEEVDCVVVSTTHDSLAAVTMAAVKAGKHVLVEKPGARAPKELVPVMAAAKRARVIVQVGFNHRFHPALRKARELIDAGGLGELMYVRGRYGHGGRPGYDKEWRANKKVSGGGELLDQGAHLIDLSRWFLGEFSMVEGFVHTYFWKMKVEDNGFALLRTKTGRAAWLHASWTEWKNMFSFEIYTKRAKIEITGLGGSYGVEKLTLYKMRPKLGPPDTASWDYPGEDESWRLEFESFARAIETGRRTGAGLADAKAMLDVVSRIYGGKR
ncbi:MAG: Gfo/Idh/MocA family oxidoreductase [Elusimicrobia bacterium]|nr:Gfo/Idh/MocA family oxidoreductase [Elusimicrobiota bacterium]